MDEIYNAKLYVCMYVSVLKLAGCTSVSTLAEVLWVLGAPGIYGFLTAATGPPPHKLMVINQMQ